MMQCYDRRGKRLVYSTCIHAYEPETPWQEKRRRRYEMRYVCPQDKSWQVYLMFGALVTAFCVMFVRWWLCV